MSQTTVVKYIVLMQDQLSPGLKRQSAALSGVNSKLAQTNAQMTTTGAKSKGLAGNMGAMVKGFAPLAIAIGAFKLLSNSVKGWDKQAKAIAQVNQGLISTKSIVGKTLQELKDEASALQSDTLFGDEEILAGATAQLLTFTNITKKEFSRTQKVVLDVATRLAAATDGVVDLKSVSIQLGKALNDPVKNLSALSRSGIQFTDQQKKMIKALWETGQQAEAQRIILKELEKQYGGSAKAAAEAGTGPLKQLKNVFGDILEGIGSKIGPILNKMAKRFKKFIENMRKHFHMIKKVMEPVFRGMRRIKEAIKKLFSALRGNNREVKTAEERWKGFSKVIKLVMVPTRLLHKAFKFLIDGIRKVVEWFKRWESGSENVRKVLLAFKAPFLILKKGFEWLDRRLDMVDKFEKLGEIKAKVEKLREELKAPILTLAKKESINQQLKSLRFQADKILGKEKVFKWTIKTKKGDVGGLFDSIVDPIVDPTVTNQTEITGAAPKIFNIRVDRLVEQITINTEQFKESKEEVKQTIIEALSEGLADFQINAG